MLTLCRRTGDSFAVHTPEGVYSFVVGDFNKRRLRLMPSWKHGVITEWLFTRNERKEILPGLFITAIYTEGLRWAMGWRIGVEAPREWRIVRGELL